MDYFFEEIQYLRCVVYDSDEEGDSSKLDLSKQDYCCEAEFKLPDAIHSSKAYKIPLSNKKGMIKNCELIVKCEQLNKSSGDIVFEIHGNNISKQSFLRLSNILFNNNTKVLFLNFYIILKRLDLLLSSSQRYLQMESGTRFVLIFQFFAMLIMYVVCTISPLILILILSNVPFFSRFSNINQMETIFLSVTILRQQRNSSVQLSKPLLLLMDLIRRFPLQLTSVNSIPNILS